jgi:hypothetical protein
MNISNIMKKSTSYTMPLYYISTRDSFAYDLIEKVTVIERDGHMVKKI